MSTSSQTKRKLKKNSRIPKNLSSKIQWRISKEQIEQGLKLTFVRTRAQWNLKAVGRGALTTYKDIPNLATAFEEGPQVKAMDTLWLGNNVVVRNKRERQESWRSLKQDQNMPQF